MGILSKGNNNLTRAQSIISSIGKEEVKPEVPAVDGIAPETVETPEEPIVEEAPVVVETPAEPIIEDTPQVETPAEDTPQVETPVAIEPETPPALSDIPDEVILSKLSETLGRKIENYDDLKPKEIAVDQELQQLLEWKEKTGLSLTQWADYNKDYSSMSDVDVAKETLANKYPTFNEAEIEFELSNLVPDDYDDDRDKMRKQIELKKLVAEGRQMLESKKFELKPNTGLTEEQQKAIEFAKQAEQSQAQTLESQKVYKNSLNLAAQNLDTISLNLAEGVQINHKVEADVKNNLSDYVLKMPHWYNQDGSPNHDNIAKDGYKIKNFDTLLKTAFEQGRAAQLEESITGKPRASVDVAGKPQEGQVQTKKGNINEVVNKLSGGNKKKFRFRSK